jgi:hypothetical protein
MDFYFFGCVRFEWWWIFLVYGSMEKIENKKRKTFAKLDFKIRGGYLHLCRNPTDIPPLH